MSSKNASSDTTGKFWLWVILFFLVAVFFYLISKFQVEKANENLKNHLGERKKALDDIFTRIEYYRKLKVQMVVIKKNTSIFLRVIIVTTLLLANGIYINHCYPNELSLQHVLDCIASFNAALLFLTGLAVFAVFGSFFEIKSVYHSIQTLTLELLYKKDEETIESVLRLDLESREAIRKEIEQTEKAIIANEALLNSVEYSETTAIVQAEQKN